MTAARTDWGAVALALGLGVLAATYIGKAPPALPLLQREFGLSLAQAGWVVAMFNTLAVGTGVFFGLVSDRVGAGRTAALGLASLAAGGFLGAFAPGPSLLLAGRFLEGAGFIAVVVSAPSLIGTVTAPSDLRRALGLWSTYMPAGGSLAMLLAPLVLAASGWRALWAALAALTLALLAALWLARRRFGQRAAASRHLSDLAAGMRRAAAWWFALAFACYSLQFFTVLVWLPTFMIQQRALDVGTASVLTALVVAANIPGNLLGTWLLQRHVRRSTLVVLAQGLMAACALVIFAEGAGDLARYLCCLGLSLCGGILPAACLSSGQLLARSPAQIGGIQGLMLQGSNLGQFVGPPVITAVVGQSNWGAALPVLLACAGGGALCGLLVRRDGA